MPHTHRLIHTKTRVPVLPGETITSFRGETATLVSFTPPHTAASTGRVHVRWSDARPDTSTDSYYPGVFDLEIEETSSPPLARWEPIPYRHNAGEFADISDRNGKHHRLLVRRSYARQTFECLIDGQRRLLAPGGKATFPSLDEAKTALLTHFTTTFMESEA